MRMHVKAVRKRFLCLMLALTMVLSSGCTTVVAQAVETLDNTGDLSNTDMNDTELDLGNEITDTETDPNNTPPADEGQDEEAPMKTAAAEAAATTAATAPTITTAAEAEEADLFPA